MERVGAEIARLRQDLAHVDAAAISSVQSVRDRCDAIKAHVYVALGAALERAVRDALKQVIRELSSLALPEAAFRPSLFAMLCDAELASISDRRRQAGWEIRVGMFSRALAPTVAEFSEDVVPLDGRTLRQDHFDAIWLVFGLSGQSTPGMQHRLALRDLANGRNDVAHGHVDPVSFGKTKAVSDLSNLITRIDEVAAHFFVAFDNYLANSVYRR